MCQRPRKMWGAHQCVMHILPNSFEWRVARFLLSPTNEVDELPLNNFIVCLSDSVNNTLNYIIITNCL